MVTAEQSKYLYKKILRQYWQNLYVTLDLILTSKKVVELSFTVNGTFRHKLVPEGFLLVVLHTTLTMSGEFSVQAWR